MIMMGFLCLEVNLFRLALFIKTKERHGINGEAMVSGTKKSTVKKKTKKTKTSKSSKKQAAKSTPKKKAKKAKKKKEKRYNATDMVNEHGHLVEPIVTLEKNLGGRPSTFKPEYCQMLIDHMKEGYNFESFAARLSYQSVSSLYKWLNLHPAFREAKKIGEGLSLMWWLRLARAGATGQIKNFNSTVWIFTMKNMFGWRDKHDIKAEVKEIKEVVHQVEIGLDGDISRHRLEILE